MVAQLTDVVPVKYRNVKNRKAVKLKEDNVLRAQVIRKRYEEKKTISFASLKSLKKESDPDPLLVRGTNPRIRVRITMSRSPQH